MGYFGDVDQSPHPTSDKGWIVATTPTAIGLRVGRKRHTVRPYKPVVFLRLALRTVSIPSPRMTHRSALAHREVERSGRSSRPACSD